MAFRFFIDINPLIKPLELDLYFFKLKKQPLGKVAFSN